jgi:uncharacterized membrane protein
MILTIITIIVAPVLIVWIGSHRSMILNIFFSILLAFTCAVSAGMLTNVREDWIGPVFSFVSLAVISGFFLYVWRSPLSPLSIGDFIEKIGHIDTDSRRRSSVRADVRRQVKQYRIEIES